MSLHHVDAQKGAPFGGQTLKERNTAVVVEGSKVLFHFQVERMP